MTDDARPDYWDIIETALSTIPHDSPYYEPAVRSLEHLRGRVLAGRDRLAARVAVLEAALTETLRRIEVDHIAPLRVKHDPELCPVCLLIERARVALDADSTPKEKT
jgi:hypothetical protein